jgi:dienelactone hydrolase
MFDGGTLMSPELKTRTSPFGVVAMVALVGFGIVGRGAESAKVELHTLSTVTLSDEQFLTGARAGRPAVIAAELRLPRLGTAKLPAMVIVHGSGGIMGNEDRWTRELNDRGVATLLLDGFTPRGIVATGTDQAQLGSLTMINDAYRALELLAKHPRIDASRIGIMGGSRGGRVALYSSLKRFQRMHGPSDLGFATHLAFYTPCWVKYIDDEDVSDRPIRLFHGADDDYTPVAPCRSYVERLRRRDKDVQLIEYPGAYHLFDNPVLPLVRMAGPQTPRRCVVEEMEVGQVINTESGKPFTWDDRCVERGVMVGYNAHAHAEAIRAVDGLLRAVFKLG